MSRTRQLRLHSSPRLHSPLLRALISIPHHPCPPSISMELSRWRSRLLSTTTSSSSSGYQAFGSFHTPSTASLFAQTESTADPPLVWESTLASHRLHLESNAVANAYNRSLFALDLQTWTYLNHGAFGAPTNVAIEAAAHWRAQADAQPLAFHDRKLFPLLVRVIKALATFLGVSTPQELVLLPNATAGLHAVLASVAKEAQEQKTVVLFSTRYGAVSKMLHALKDQDASLQVYEIPLSFNDSHDDDKVVQRLERALEAVTGSGRHVTLVVVDHITSTTAVAMPVHKIVQQCHGRDRPIPVLVDGAHGLLNVPLDLDALGADYYVGNCHKWCCAPRGAAFLHVARKSGPTILPRVLSHGAHDGMQSAFMWTGLQDVSAWLALPQCLAYWQRQNVESVREYMHTLAQAGAELLYTRWNMATHVESERLVPLHKRHAMRLVELPTGRPLCGGVVVDGHAPRASATEAKRVQDGLHASHCIEVPVKCIEARLYVRVSAHVYNCLADFERLATAIIER